MTRFLTLVFAAFCVHAHGQSFELDSYNLNLCEGDSVLLGLQIPNNLVGSTPVVMLPWKTSCVFEEGWELGAFDDSQWSGITPEQGCNPQLINAIQSCGGSDYMVWAEGQCADPFFRTTFEYAQGNDLFLDFTADNAFQLYFNGTEIVSGNAWSTCYSIDLTPYTQNGTNILAVRAQDYGGGGPGACKGIFGTLHTSFSAVSTSWNGAELNENTFWASGSGVFEQTLTLVNGQSSSSTIVVNEGNNEGCTDASACNYDPSAFCNDNSCVYPVFNEDCNAGSIVCGEGTVWDSTRQTCEIANPADTNLDGCVQLNDLLDVLSAYGDCGAEEAPWACGAPLSYQGYDYATVQIGDQCWFAENLRYLPAVSPPDLGREDDGGPHAYVYGYAGTDVAQAINSTYYNDFGALYNFEAVSEWPLCPAGWHVPAADEWDMLTMTFGSGVGQKLKQIPPLWDGTNELGFNAIKVPVRSNGPGWNHIDTYSDFWTSSEKDANNAWGRELNTGSNNIGVDDNGKNAGCPVRCLQDAE